MNRDPSYSLESEQELPADIYTDLGYGTASVTESSLVPELEHTGRFLQPLEEHKMNFTL